MQLPKHQGKAVEEIKASLDDLGYDYCRNGFGQRTKSLLLRILLKCDHHQLSNTRRPINQRYTHMCLRLKNLEAEIAKKVNREVTELVVHWTDTYSNKNIGSEELNRDSYRTGHRKRNRIPLRDTQRWKSLQRGRPVNM